MGRFDLRSADKARRLAYRQSFIPKNADLTLDTEPEVAIYRYPIGRGTTIGYGVMVFCGSAGKPTEHYSYRTIEQANKTIESWLDRVSLHRIERQRKQSEKRAWINPAKVGDLLYTSWGYEQTNVEFYAVTRVSGKRLWIRQIVRDSQAVGFMQNKCWPAMPIRFCGEETRHTAQSGGGSDNGAYSVKINESATAWLEQGREHYSSSYA